MLTKEEQKKFESVYRMEEEMDENLISSELKDNSENPDMSKVFTEDMGDYEKMVNILYAIDNIRDFDINFLKENYEEELAYLSTIKMETAS